MTASALLLGACSHLNSARALFPPPPAPVRLADRSTNWGPQPSYDGKGQYFYHMLRPRSRDYVLNGITILELLVNRDGTVQKMAVVSSSGDSATDQVATEMYWRARYSLSLGPDDPAPYVVRQTVVFKNPRGRKPSGGTPDFSLTHQPLPPTTENNNAGNTNTVNGFVR